MDDIKQRGRNVLWYQWILSDSRISSVLLRSREYLRRRVPPHLQATLQRWGKKIFFYKTNLLNNISPSLAEPHTRTPPTKVRWRNIVRFTSSWGLFSSDGYGDPVWLSGWNEDREGLFEPKSGSWWCTVAQAVLDKRNTFLYFKRTPFDFLVYIQRRVQRRPVADSTEVKRTKSTNEVNERC